MLRATGVGAVAGFSFGNLLSDLLSKSVQLIRSIFLSLEVSFGFVSVRGTGLGGVLSTLVSTVLVVEVTCVVTFGGSLLLSSLRTVIFPGPACILELFVSVISLYEVSFGMSGLMFPLSTVVVTVLVVALFSVGLGVVFSLSCLRTVIFPGPGLMVEFFVCVFQDVSLGLSGRSDTRAGDVWDVGCIV